MVIKIRYTMICESCGANIKINEKEYEKHIKRNHSTKINTKDLYLNTTIRRELNG